MKNHQKYLTLAAQEARKGILKKAGGPFGAVLIKNNRIIAKAHNTVLKTNDPTCHAEMNAIRKAVRGKKTPFLEKITIYSTTEPCPMCFSALHWAKINKIVYSTVIQDVKKLGFNELTIPSRKMKTIGKSSVSLLQLKNKDCGELLNQWKKLPNQKTY